MAAPPGTGLTYIGNYCQSYHNNIHNSGNSHYHSISRRIILVLAPVSPRDKLPVHLVVWPTPPSRRQTHHEVTQTTEHPITMAQHHNVYSCHYPRPPPPPQHERALNKERSDLTPNYFTGKNPCNEATNNIKPTQWV